MKLAISMNRRPWLRHAVGRCAVAAAVSFIPASAHADDAAAKKPTQTHKTSDYTEQTSVAGDSVVSFTGDELAAPPGGAYGDIIRRPPGVTRVGLIRPRLNFVVEMLKSVENL